MQCKEEAYLVIQVLKSESELLALRDPRYTKIEPRSIEVAVEERGRVSGNPEVKTIFIEAFLNPSKIAATEVTAEHNFSITDFSPDSLRVRLQ
jgi:hypothetical protein